MPQNLLDSWTKIHDWLADKAPSIKKALNPPVNKDRFNDLEDLIGKSLPKDFKELYSLHDGLSSNEMANLVYGMQFLPIEQVIGEVKLMIELSADGNTPLTHADDGIEKGYCFNKSRIPIGSDSGTCLLCVDLEPSKNGTYGQIILLDYDSDVALNIATSISSMYLVFSQDLQRGEYFLAEDALEDGIEWLEPSKEIDIINWYGTSRWGNIEF